MLEPNRVMARAGNVLDRFIDASDQFSFSISASAAAPRARILLPARVRRGMHVTQRRVAATMLAQTKEPKDEGLATTKHKTNIASQFSFS